MTSYAEEARTSTRVSVNGNAQLYTTFDWLRGSANRILDDIGTYLTNIENSVDIKSVPAVALPDKSFNHPYIGISWEGLEVPGDISIPDAPTFDESIGEVVFDEVEDPGEYDGFEYEPVFPLAPTISEVEDPGDWDGTIDVTVPTDLILDDLVDPLIQGIVVPIIPELNISPFTGTAPTLDDLIEPDISFDFTEIDYTSDVLTQTDSLIQQMLSGGVGIPETVWNRIWARAGVQIDNTTKETINEINIEWASRGFSLPQGVQVAQIAEARQEAFNKKAELARDNAIAYSQEEIKNLQFAVQQGIAFETLRGGWYDQATQRAFESAKFVIESEIKLFEVNITLKNTAIQLFNTEAQVYKTLIDAEIAALEKYRLDIAAQELTLSANDNQIKLYGARIQALQLTIEDFNARVNAAKVEATVMQVEVQVYSEEIKAFVSRIQAESEKVNLYKSIVDAENSKVGAYETSVKVYGHEIDVYSSKVGASSTKVKSEVDIEQLKLASYDSAIKGYASEVSAKADAYKAEVAKYDSTIKSFGISAQDNQYKTQALIDGDKNTISYDSEKTKLQISDAANASRAAEASVQLAIETQKSAAEINAGLAGSIYSAMNVASTESVRTSGNLNTSISYDGGNV